ncbi:dynein light chain Tctex-type 5-like isoform X2 [Rhodnius prolixus]|uniref:dynein light chain Tctex-type 5-like isoform X2 n=1 Tax=Rhodnius prolixus TaxID=13249 RepID=UPI003D187DC5
MWLDPQCGISLVLSVVARILLYPSPVSNFHPSEQVKYFRKRNTHRLDSRNPFRADPVYRIIEEIMTDSLESFYYNPDESVALCIELSAKIRAKLKLLNYDRYKLVCVVDIIQKNLQDVRTVCSFLCDPKRDNYAIFKFDKFDLLAVAYVFGVYKE